MRFIVTLLFTATIACSAAAVAFAGPPDEPAPGGRAPRHGGPPPVEVLGAEAERLGLDDATRTAIKTVVTESRAEADTLKEKIADAREEIRRLLKEPDVQEAAVMQQADTVGALELEQHKNWLRAMLRIRALLTPEQRVELIKMREEMFAAVFAGARESCTEDLGRFCPAATGDEQMRACLRRNREDLSTRCREAIAAQFAKRRARP